MNPPSSSSLCQLAPSPLSASITMPSMMASSGWRSGFATPPGPHRDTLAGRDSPASMYSKFGVTITASWAGSAGRRAEVFREQDGVDLVGVAAVVGLGLADQLGEPDPQGHAAAARDLERRRVGRGQAGRLAGGV